MNQEGRYHAFLPKILSTAYLKAQFLMSRLNHPTGSLSPYLFFEQRMSRFRLPAAYAGLLFLEDLGLCKIQHCSPS
jgi:hypothetical protein